MTSNEMARLSGATLRQLQYWDELGLLRAKRTGRNRSYSPTQVKRCKRIVQVSDKGRNRHSVEHLLRRRWTRVVTISEPTVIGGALVIPKYGAKFS